MKTRIVEVRDVRPDENGIETLEGFKPCDPNAHYIMRGIEGEEYPIEKDIFNKTYAFLYGEHGDIQPTKKDRLLAIIYDVKSWQHGSKRRADMDEAIDIIKDHIFVKFVEKKQ